MSAVIVCIIRSSTYPCEEQDKENDLTEFLALGGRIPTTVRRNPIHGPEHACGAYPRKKQDKEDNLIGFRPLAARIPRTISINPVHGHEYGYCSTYPREEARQGAEIEWPSAARPLEPLTAILSMGLDSTYPGQWPDQGEKLTDTGGVHSQKKSTTTETGLPRGKSSRHR